MEVVGTVVVPADFVDLPCCKLFESVSSGGELIGESGLVNNLVRWLNYFENEKKYYVTTFVQLFCILGTLRQMNCFKCCTCSSCALRCFQFMV